MVGYGSYLGLVEFKRRCGRYAINPHGKTRNLVLHVREVSGGPQAGLCKFWGLLWITIASAFVVVTRLPSEMSRAY